MSSKIISLGVAAILSVACTSTKKMPAKQPPPPPQQETKIPKTEDIIIEDTTKPGATTPAPGEPTSQIPPETENPVRTASVWIEGIGTDAFLALGFMQELEKHVKIESVHGVGFGCWIAVSWASENRGSYAEWQAFKWDTWDVLGANILNRVIGRSNSDAFRARIENRMPLKSKDRFKIPETCPYVFKDKTDFESSRDLAVHEELWTQMRNPYFFPMTDIENDERRSGLFRPSVTPAEFVKMTPANVRPEEHVWIILTNEIIRSELRRAPQPELQRGIIDGVRWIRKSIAPGQYTISDAKDLKKKRSMLLRGRKEGKVFFQTPAVTQFIGFGSNL